MGLIMMAVAFVGAVILALKIVSSNADLDAKVQVYLDDSRWPAEED